MRWLISGPAGLGKINLALVLARRLLGAARRTRRTRAPLRRSRPWLRAMRSLDHHPDLHWLHPEEDKETISVDQVRELIETFTLTAHRGGAKIVIVEPAEALTTAAANALLKTLEEPTAGQLPVAAESPTGAAAGDGPQSLPAPDVAGA